ncbi:peptidoglycan-binding protein [Streptomyces sp. NPDC001380]|uniref:peptidoglycan-binding protein n=1 Tax=Streptomyces sp. NPDC001380 TaxID=3364566 RepID=UPI0036D00297
MSSLRGSGRSRDDEDRARRGRGALWATAGVVSALAAAGAALFATGTFGHEQQAPAARVHTATVVRTTLVDQVMFQGKLGTGTATALPVRAQGTVTWLPATGSVLRRGDAVVRIDNLPVTLLYGGLPAYRELKKGTTGADVLQFTTNLRALGYVGFAVGDHYDSGVVAAVDRWQKALGRPATGRIALGDVVYAPGPRTVTKQLSGLGTPAAEQVVSVAGTSRVAVLNVPEDDVALLHKGTGLTLRLADGTRTEATVSTIAAESSPSAEGGDSRTVTASVTGQSRARGATGPVAAEMVKERHAGVLAVPVEALLALSGGGHGVEIVDAAGAGHVVAVRPGLYADGKVEISGAGLAEGVKVKVAE